MHSSAAIVITSLCVGLTMGPVAIAQERAGLFIPRPGMQFTTAFTNEFGKDAESLTTIKSVTDDAVSIEYSSSRGVSVRRELLVTDRREASAYVLGYESEMPNVIPGDYIAWHFHPCSVRAAIPRQRPPHARLFAQTRHHRVRAHARFERGYDEHYCRRSRRRHASPSCAGAVR